MTNPSTSDRKSFDEALDDEMRAERAESLSGPESSAGRDLARAIGENVARLRAAAGLSVAALADRAGLVDEQIEIVETGHGLPGLRMLWLLASGLEVPFGALLEHTLLSEAADPGFRVQRADRGRTLSTPGGLRSRALSASSDVAGPEVYDLTLDAGAVEAAEAHGGTTFEHIIVTAGQLRVQVGEKVADLAAGDSIMFRADVAHAYENPATTPARALLIMIYG